MNRPSSVSSVSSVSMRMYVKPNRHVVCGAIRGPGIGGRDRTPVFQLMEKVHVHILEVEEARDMCRFMPERHQDEIYASRGVYGENVRLYWFTVKALEKMFAQS